MSADTTLAEWIAELRSTRSDIAASMDDIAAACKAESDAIVSTGVGLGGDEWVPRKDGARALVNAASAITVTAVADVIVFAIKEPYIYHQYGAGVPRRPLLPLGGLPVRLGNAIRKGLVQGLTIMKRHGR